MTAPKKQLLLGCGNSRERHIWIKDEDQRGFEDLTTLDSDPRAKPDVLHDLNNPRLPFDAETFDEIHAYEVLEHCGRQGDVRFFFEQFNDFYRVLKPGGMVFATVPMWDSVWAWGDPQHTRVITKMTLTFLQRDEYENQIGRTAMSDYRHLLLGDWEVLGVSEENDTFGFVLRKK